MKFETNNTINIEDLKKDFQALKKLKFALGISNENVTLPDLLKICIEHNKYEYYLMTFMIDCIINLPKEIKNQFDLIISNMNNQKKRKQLLTETENLYETNIVFIKHKEKLNEDLEFSEKDNKNYFNQIIYEICCKDINSDIILEEDNVILNLYLLQNWLFSQDYGNVNNLNNNEINAFHISIQDGYSNNVKKSDIKNINKKLRTKTFLQSLAKFYFYLNYKQ